GAILTGLVTSKERSCGSGGQSVLMIYGLIAPVSTSAADVEEMESARVLILLHAVAANQSALANWVQHFGGSLAEGGTALFGLPRATVAMLSVVCCAPPRWWSRGRPVAFTFKPATGRMIRFPQ
ncbi:hypothetical protein, partial [Litchfieldella rifensis]